MGSVSCSVLQVVDALHHAGEDERVQGLVTIIGEGEAPERLAQVQELQDAVLHFR